jgi:hypothetical protein
MNDDTKFKNYAHAVLKDQADNLATTILNGKDPSKTFRTANVGHYSIDSTIHPNSISIAENVELIIGDEKYTYDEIKTMLSVLK